MQFLTKNSPADRLRNKLADSPSITDLIGGKKDGIHVVKQRPFFHIFPQNVADGVVESV